jgi:uncharacterized protein (DUF58 family)
MMAVEKNLIDVRPSRAGALAAEIESPSQRTSNALRPSENVTERIAFQPSETLLSPAPALPWLLGSLGVAACIAPWLIHGWRWFEVIATIGFLVTCCEAFALWLARKAYAPVLLSSSKEIRGCEGQSIQIPLALAGSGRRRVRRDVRLAIMAATRESEPAISVTSGPQHFRLERSEPAEKLSAPASSALVHLWPWTPEIALLRRGRWPVPRVGIESRSRLGIWRLRQWFDSPALLRIDADLRPGRRGILRSPVYRALVAARQAPWTGHGREFERLREYQAGDNYAEIAWKSTARRGVPVTRLFQWEQKQEVYFVVDQSRASASLIDPALETYANSLRARAPRRLLDLAVETALVGATVALELGDEFGLVTYAEEPKTWLRAGSGQFQFSQFRDRLLNLEPLSTTADYEGLFSKIRLQLRRRAYLVLLADLAERSLSDSMRRGVALLGTSHVVLMTSVLPAYARPAFSLGEQPGSEEDVYAALAGEKENQRLAALGRQLRHLGAELRFVSPEKFLRTAVEGYLESKREQRV